jgi:hypothetical protein
MDSSVLLLDVVSGFLLLPVLSAVVNDTPQGACVAAGVLRRTPYRRNTELGATALLVVVRTIDPPPSVATADFDAPALSFGVLELPRPLSSDEGNGPSVIASMRMIDVVVR